MTQLTAEVFKIGNIDRGFLAIMARPYIEVEEAASIANIARLGIHQVVSLLEPTEARNLGLESERLEVRARDMGFVSFPIPDMGRPSSLVEFSQLSRDLCAQISSGINTLIHCRAGIGRSGLMAAAILLHTGMNVREAFDHVSKMRGVKVPETPEQELWLNANYTEIVSPS